MLRLKQLTLFLGDMSMLYIGLFIALYIRYLESPGYRFTELLAPMGVLFFAGAVVMFIVGLYDISRTKNSWNFYQKIILSAIVWLVLGIIYFYVKPNTTISPKTILLLTSFTGFGLLALWRFFYNKYISTTIWRVNVIFAGVTDEVKELIKIIREEPQRGYYVSGIIADAQTCSNIFPDIPCGSNISEINAQNNSHPANLIVMSPGLASNEDLLKELYKKLFQQVSVISLADFYEDVIKRIPPFTFSEGWFISNLREQEKKMYDRFKILIDYLAGILLGIFFAVTFPFIALAIKLNSKGPIFYCQYRIGRQGTPFKVCKYRTMKALSADGGAETQGPQYASNNDSRITKVGKFLRGSRLDEIPQFINILKGEMAIIGPRPERPEFVDQLTEKMPYYALRHVIKPGLTGWAQVHNAYYGDLGENLQKLEYDLYYIKNRGLVLDISISLRTINILARMIGR